MRLFHVSEESEIEIFNPRIPTRTDLDQSVGLVWAINEKCLPNFLTPRNCPRVTYHIGLNTSESDMKRYISTNGCSHVVVIETKWFEILKNTKLYLYEFDSKQFELQDNIAGYYISKTPQTPIAKFELTNLVLELSRRNVEIRVLDNLWDICEEIQQTTFNWSMCRMGFAQPSNKM